jgi:RimJ/RimL family protein N-acetyltransferase
MKEVQLKNSFLTLRQNKSVDVLQSYLAIQESIQELSPFMPWCHADYSIEDQKTWIELCTKNWDERNEFNFAITDSRDGTYLGGCGLNHINLIDQIANLGYWVRSNQVNRGIATAATLLLAQFGFNELKLNRIEIVVAVENKASQRVAEKAGALKEGVMRNRLFLHNKAHDAVIFSLIPTDLDHIQAKLSKLNEMFSFSTEPTSL